MIINEVSIASQLSSLLADFSFAKPLWLILFAKTFFSIDFYSYFTAIRHYKVLRSPAMKIHDIRRVIASSDIKFLRSETD
jgi:hypothetical protein